MFVHIFHEGQSVNEKSTQGEYSALTNSCVGIMKFKIPTRYGSPFRCLSTHSHSCRPRRGWNEKVSLTHFLRSLARYASLPVKHSASTLCLRHSHHRIWKTSASPLNENPFYKHYKPQGKKTTTFESTNLTDMTVSWEVPACISCESSTPATAH